MNFAEAFAPDVDPSGPVEEIQRLVRAIFFKYRDQMWPWRGSLPTYQDIPKATDKIMWNSLDSSLAVHPILESLNKHIDPVKHCKVIQKSVGRTCNNFGMSQCVSSSSHTLLEFGQSILSIYSRHILPIEDSPIPKIARIWARLCALLSNLLRCRHTEEDGCRLFGAPLPMEAT